MSKIKKSVGVICTAIIISYFIWPSGSTPNASAVANQPTEKTPLHGDIGHSPSLQKVSTSLPTLNTKKPASLAQQDSKELSPIERIKAIQNKTSLHQSLIDDHQQFTRYPSYNKAIAQSSKDPIISRYEAYERSTLSKDKNHTLTIWTEKRFYLNDEVATFYASLKDQQGNDVSTSFAAQVIFGEQLNIAQLEFESSPHNGYQTASLTLDAATYKEGIYKVLIANRTNELADALTFTLSRPLARLTGEYQDQVVDGKLRIMAEVEVEQSNRYYLEASLYSSTNDPIGTTQFADRLESGTHWIPLDFSGLMILDAGEPAPFILRNISLAKVAMPIQRAPLSNPNYATQQYDLAQFLQSEGGAQEPL